MITASMVSSLREKTGCGMMDCKKALTEANGDVDKAVELLREKGLAAAEKKAGRIAAEGIVDTYVSEDGKVGVVVEVNSETDFVAKNADFQTFVKTVAKIIADQNPADVDALKAMSYDDKQSVEEALREKILTIGENINIRRFERFEGVVSTYVHGGGRIGVMVLFDAPAELAGNDTFKEAAKDVAMQVAAAAPQYLNRDEVPADVVEKEKEILSVQAKNEGKPEAIIEKMVNGRINKFYQEVCLVDQVFIKDGNLSVTKMLDEKASELGTKIGIAKYVRFEKGEGLEKREDDFAAEVASMMK